MKLLLLGVYELKIGVLWTMLRIGLVRPVTVLMTVLFVFMNCRTSAAAQTTYHRKRLPNGYEWRRRHSGEDLHTYRDDVELRDRRGRTVFRVSKSTRFVTLPATECLILSFTPARELGFTSPIPTISIRSAESLDACSAIGMVKIWRTRATTRRTIGSAMISS